MRRDFQPEDVVAARPTWGVLLRRGMTKHCPRCGGGRLFDGWFRMKERCPTCGVRFEREPGFFVGAYFINFAVAEGFLFVLLMGFLFWKDKHPDAGVVVPLILGLVIAVVAPIVCYPFAKTTWSALDILMTPLELAEIVAAADATDDGADAVSDEEPDDAAPPGS